MTYRIGHGYDLHRLEALGPGSRAKPLVVGGVLLEIPPLVEGSVVVGVVAHSDGDVLFHAMTDALLGALGMADIGQLFPDHDPKYAGRASEFFVAEAARLVREGGWEIGNVDATVVLERPRLSPHKETIRASVARALGVEVGVVNVKGKSHEGVDAVGEGRAIEAHAVVLLVR